jgi:hypothetical protein
MTEAEAVIGCTVNFKVSKRGRMQAGPVLAESTCAGAPGLGRKTIISLTSQWQVCNKFINFNGRQHQALNGILQIFIYQTLCDW